MTTTPTAEIQHRVSEVKIGEEWETIKGLNRLQDLDAGRLVCHVHPAPTDLGQDVLRALGMRSSEPGWPANDVATRYLAETWLRAIAIRKIVFYPAEHLSPDWLDDFSEIAFEGEIILAHRDSTGHSLDQVQNVLDAESRINDYWEPVGEIPALSNFDWPHQMFSARVDALRNLKPDRFVAFDDAWTHAFDMTRERNFGSSDQETARWLRTIATRGDGRICPALFSGAVSALVGMDRTFAHELPRDQSVNDQKVVDVRSSASPEIQAVLVLRSMGFSTSEISAMCIGQIRRRDDQLEVMGIAVPKEHVVSLRAQVIYRLRGNAKSTDPLIAVKKARGNFLVIREALSWRSVFERKAPTVTTVWPEISVTELLDIGTYDGVREIQQTHRRRGVHPDQLNMPEATLRELISGGLIEINGENVRVTDELTFSLGDNDLRRPLNDRARKTRNFARLAERDPRIAAEIPEDLSV